MRINPVSRISAIDFIRMMGGSSQAALVEADDHNQYVVKWMCEPRSTINIRTEALRNSLYQLLGLPVSSWTTIEITDRFIDEFPEMRIRSSGLTMRPAAGIHFGSRLVHDSTERLYEIVPAHWYPRVINRSDFWGAYTLDIWTERFSPRQALFQSFAASSDLIALFIDHGNSKTSSSSENHSNFGACMFPDRRIYETSEVVDVIHDWVYQIQHHGRSSIASAHDTLPSDWKTSSVDGFAHGLINRIDNLTECIFPSIVWLHNRREVLARKACCDVQLHRDSRVA